MPGDNNGWFCSQHRLVALGNWMPLGVCSQYLPGRTAEPCQAAGKLTDFSVLESVVRE